MKVRKFKRLKCRATYQRRMNWNERRGMRRAAEFRKRSKRQWMCIKHEERREEAERAYNMQPSWEHQDYYDDHSAFKSIERRL